MENQFYGFDKIENPFK